MEEMVCGLCAAGVRCTEWERCWLTSRPLCVLPPCHPCPAPLRWPRQLKAHEVTAAIIQEADERVLGHCVDVDVREKDNSDYSIVFTFQPNEYFSNATLTKHICFSEQSEETAPPDAIHWHAGMNYTDASSAEAPVADGDAGSNKRGRDEEDAGSFFDWFLVVGDDGDYIGEAVKEIWVDPMPYFNSAWQQDGDAGSAEVDMEGEGNEAELEGEQDEVSELVGEGNEAELEGERDEVSELVGDSLDGDDGDEDDVAVDIGEDEDDAEGGATVNGETGEGEGALADADAAAAAAVGDDAAAEAAEAAEGGDALADEAEGLADDGNDDDNDDDAAVEDLLQGEVLMVPFHTHSLVRARVCIVPTQHAALPFFERETRC